MVRYFRSVGWDNIFARYLPIVNNAGIDIASKLFDKMYWMVSLIDRDGSAGEPSSIRSESFDSIAPSKAPLDKLIAIDPLRGISSTTSGDSDRVFPSMTVVAVFVETSFFSLNWTRMLCPGSKPRDDNVVS